MKYLEKEAVKACICASCKRNSDGNQCDPEECEVFLSIGKLPVLEINKCYDCIYWNQRPDRMGGGIGICKFDQWEIVAEDNFCRNWAPKT